MAKKYCKKSSMQAVAGEVKTRKGSSSNIQGNNIASDISNLVIPTQRGSPTTVLTPSSTSKTIQRGKYIGGSVSVVLQDATAQLSQNGGYVPIENGKTLASVKVPAKNTVSYAVGKITPSDKSTSIQVTGLSFSPTGFIVMCTSPGGTVSGSSGALATVCCYKQGNSYVATGFLPNQSAYFGVVTSASASFGDSSFSVSSVVGARNGSTINTVFRNREYCWFAWG
jgi:hypothetical protein